MESSADATGPSNTVTYDHSSSSQDKKTSELAMSVANGPANPSLHSGTSASSTSECIAAGSVSSGPGLSPSSSMGSSEKSTLNPNAKVCIWTGSQVDILVCLYRYAHMHVCSSPWVLSLHLFNLCDPYMNRDAQMGFYPVPGPDPPCLHILGDGKGYI